MAVRWQILPLYRDYGQNLSPLSVIACCWVEGCLIQKIGFVTWLMVCTIVKIVKIVKIVWACGWCVVCVPPMKMVKMLKIFKMIQIHGCVGGCVTQTKMVKMVKMWKWLGLVTWVMGVYHCENGENSKNCLSLLLVWCCVRSEFAS